jgi:uncharacterized protein DUF932
MAGLAPSYGFVSTQEIVDKLASLGWKVAEEKIAKVRKPERAGFQRHIVRLHHDDYKVIPGLTENNKSRLELCAMNAHDGTTRLRLFFGILRFLCLNGLMAGTSLREFSTVHSGDLVKKIGDGVDFMTAGIPELIGQIQKLQGAKFTEAAYKEYVKRLVDARLKHVGNIVSVDYSSASLATRPGDAADDAFTAYNRVQEKLMKGGIHFTYNRIVKDEDGNQVGTKLVNGSTRKLTSIPQAIALNRTAYDLAIEMAA